MNSEEILNAWKEQNRKIEVSSDFSSRVMGRIGQYEQKKKPPLFDMQRLIDFVSLHPLAQAGMFAAGAVIGFVRVAFVIRVLLFG